MTVSFNSYFTNFTVSKAIFYLSALIYVGLFCVIVILEPLVTIPCTLDPNYERPDFENVLYDYSPCDFVRSPKLLWINRSECNFGRRLVISTIFGGIVGWERRQADRPAGIRTMALVSLGACLFTINSTHAFRTGPMNWDASRISAAIPSGVGFLGSALIFKQSTNQGSPINFDSLVVHGLTTGLRFDFKQSTNQGSPINFDSLVVHGLTTATSLWVSAAIGVACGGGLYFSASFTVALLLVILRFVPRTQYSEDDDDDDDDDGERENEEKYDSFNPRSDALSEMKSLKSESTRQRSHHKVRPSLV
eukprot:CAMPEP_0172519726 /NCGR_PEP_ID=MMETSP1066-20121228/291585_1 /TAXON_ID=671091 /ORGANISM="Coscinodiscus wailesii, Strain CCMP2513" /LENGTH=305 /DNA_ID=CAMNT_0013302361 /DNA_START=124 /DNA_END=1042 /DNA_ORIENTATION=+